MLRAIREIRPRFVVGENVGGLINWSDGLVFEQVCADLEAEGYEVQPFVLPACGVNAPHRRDRVWFIAHRANAGFESVRFGGENAVYEFKSASNAQRQAREQGDDGREKCKPYNRKEIRPIYCSGGKVTPHPKSKRSTGLRIGTKPTYAEYGSVGEYGDVANPCHQGLQRGKNYGGIRGFGEKREQQPSGSIRTDWSNFPTQPPLCSRNDGFSSELVGITLSKHRNESIKAYGNAIVPQVALQIFKAIAQYEAL